MLVGKRDRGILSDGVIVDDELILSVNVFASINDEDK